ncbi:choice-of-anchor M domain-containing protein, partial [Actinomyces bouchesdurhonensis]|uniref:choice-of-anchor M domain-containing protein n=1 Tax=Actinomyces bouchesdurhonensis TaxID=1852361 RepID=UPI003C73A1CD
NPDRLPVASRRVDVSYDLVPGTTDQYTATVRAADPTLRATYKIEFLESKYDFSPWCSMEGTLGAGGVDMKQQDLGVCQSDPMYVRVTLRPHPLSDAVMTVADASDVTVGEHVGLTATLNLRDGVAAPEEPEPAPMPTPDPSPSPGHGNGEAPAPASSLLSDPVEIARGHLDVRLTQAAGENGTTYGLAVKDDSLTAARTSVLRTLSSTTLSVGPNARFVRPASLSDASYDVLGPVGAATYVLPETQNSDIVWPGLSTEGIDYTALPEGADLTLHLAQAPVGARVAFFQGGTFGAGAKVHFDSTKGDGVVHTTEATHMHGNWVFSAPGTYRIEVGARSGQRILAEPQSITVIVRGGHHEQPDPAPGDNPAPAPSPGPTPTPEPEPSPEPSPEPAPSVDPAPAPNVDTAPASSVDPAPGARTTPGASPAPNGAQGKTLSRIAPTGAPGTTGGGVVRSAGGPATTSGSGSAPAASSGGSPVSAPKAAPAATPSPTAVAGSGAQSGENPQSAAPEATAYGSNDAAAAAMPVATSAESGRSAGWSPYWLLLLVIPAALAGGGAGFLIRTR